MDRSPSRCFTFVAGEIETTIHARLSIPLRQLGDQEVDIIRNGPNP